MANADFTSIKEGLESGILTPQDASKFMRRPDSQEFIHDMVSQFDEGVVALEDSTLQTLADAIYIAYYIYTYSSSETGMSDTEYDKLYELIVLNGKEEFVSLPILEDETNDNVDYHKYPVLRGTLSKIHYLAQPKEKAAKSRRSLESWIESTEKLYLERTGRHLDFKEVECYVFPKWDGCSVIFEFDKDGKIEKALTRGYTKLNTAENITRHFKGLTRPIEENVPYGLKTEVMMLESSVMEYNEMYEKDYKQSRAIVSGILNSDKPDERNNYLVIVQLRYMKEGEEIESLCPQVFDSPYIRCKLGAFDAIEAFAQEHRFTRGLRCDGAVIHIIDPEIQKILGRANDKNRFEVAYKFTEEYAYTEVEDVEFQVGLLGRITPVVKVKPVKLKGNTINSASLSSIDRLEYLKLAKGDKIKILYDIIPYATLDNECEEHRSLNKMIRPKEKCPSCGEKLERKGAFLFCTNPDCDCRRKGKILNYLVKLRIQDISYATVDELYEMGILTKIEDLYSLKDHKDEIVDHPGFGEVSFDNWVNQIESKRRVPDYSLLGAIGIDGLAEKNFAKILQMFTINDLFDIVKAGDEEILTLVNGIGEKKAKALIKGIKDNKSLIKFLMKELEIYHENTANTKFTVCFTKIRDKEMEEFIESLGGKTVNSVTNDTTYCVVPDLSVSSSKTAAAIKRGVEIISIDNLKEELLKKYSK